MMPRWLRRALYAIFLWPSFKDAGRSDAVPQAVGRVGRRFVILHAQIGERGHVKIANVKISSGDPELDRQAVREIKAQVHPVQRVGHKAVARWHVLRWEVPADRPSLEKRN